MTCKSKRPSAGDAGPNRGDCNQLASLLHPELTPSYTPQQGPLPTGWRPSIPQSWPATPKVDPTLPFGCWLLADASEVLFNRNYQPLWRRTLDGTVTRVDPDQRFDWIKQSWLYDDSNPPERNPKTRKRLKLILALFTDGRA
jgi:hypothetical protein